MHSSCSLVVINIVLNTHTRARTITSTILVWGATNKDPATTTTYPPLSTTRSSPPFLLGPQAHQSVRATPDFSIHRITNPAPLFHTSPTYVLRSRYVCGILSRGVMFAICIYLILEMGQPVLYFIFTRCHAWRCPCL